MNVSKIRMLKDACSALDLCLLRRHIAPNAEFKRRPLPHIYQEVETAKPDGVIPIDAAVFSTGRSL